MPPRRYAADASYMLRRSILLLYPPYAAGHMFRRCRLTLQMMMLPISPYAVVDADICCRRHAFAAMIRAAMLTF